MSNIDDKINELFETVRKQKAELEEAEKEAKSSWKTRCVIHLDSNAQPVSIQTANEDMVKHIVAALLRNRDYLSQAEKILGMTSVDKFDGYSYEEWFSDCKKRIASLGLKSKKEKLVAMEKRLDAIVSPEQRRQMELEAITKSLAE